MYSDISIPFETNRFEGYDFNSIYLVHPENSDAIDNPNSTFVPDAYEARVAYDSEEALSDADLEEIAIAQSNEEVTVGNDPIFLNIFGSTNIREDVKLNSSLFGQIRGMFDSGASICCIDKVYAYANYRKYIKKLTDFYVKTANGRIIISEYIPLRIRTKNEDIYTRFYLLNRSPHKFIISRRLFLRLGYQIIDPDGNVFSNTASHETLDENLYGDLYKHMHYPMGRPKEQFQGKKRKKKEVAYIQKLHELYALSAHGQETLAKTHATEQLLQETTLAHPGIEEIHIPGEEPKVNEEDVDCGEIKTKKYARNSSKLSMNMGRTTPKTPLTLAYCPTKNSRSN